MRPPGVRLSAPSPRRACANRTPRLCLSRQGYLPANADRRPATLQRKQTEYFAFIERYYDSRNDEAHQDTFRQVGPFSFRVGSRRGFDLAPTGGRTCFIGACPVGAPTGVPQVWRSLKAGDRPGRGVPGGAAGLALRGLRGLHGHGLVPHEARAARAPSCFRGASVFTRLGVARLLRGTPPLGKERGPVGAVRCSRQMAQACFEAPWAGSPPLENQFL